MHRWNAGEVVTHGTRLHYYRTDGGRPPLVLLHGFSDDGLCWTPVAEVLSEDFDVIMVDACGHGKSEAPDQGYGQRTMATEVAGLIEALSLEKPAILGHSMGAATALTLASLYPELPRAILLEDPPAIWNAAQNAQGAERRNFFIGWIEQLKRKTRDELLTEVRADNPVWSEAELGPWADSKHRLSTKIIKLLTSSDEEDVGLERRVQGIHCPVLLMTADPERGAIVTEDDARLLKELIPDLQVVHIARAGHYVQHQQFDLYLQAITDFLVRSR
ncbi:MAG: alpha/beta hydrolase [Anaerolineales bacterium]|nr:alpha/beta hydrolase [Anaerolineales bacterium]